MYGYEQSVYVYTHAVSICRIEIHTEKKEQAKVG